jgi:hypothetical protein
MNLTLPIAGCEIARPPLPRKPHGCMPPTSDHFRRSKALRDHNRFGDVGLFERLGRGQVLDRQTDRAARQRWSVVARCGKARSAVQRLSLSLIANWAGVRIGKSSLRTSRSSPPVTRYPLRLIARARR